MKEDVGFERSLNEMFEEFGINQSPSDILDSNPRAVVDPNVSTSVKLDIQLRGGSSGVQLAKRLASELNIPFVVLDTNGVNRTTAEASVTIPSHYLNNSKQVTLNALSKLFLNKFEGATSVSSKEELSPSHKIENAIFIKDNTHYVKILFDEIDFVKSDGNYIEIHSNDRVSVLKKTMKNFEGKVSGHSFFQIHRSYLINLNKITSIGPMYVDLGNHRLPLSKKKKEKLLEIIDTF